MSYDVKSVMGAMPGDRRKSSLLRGLLWLTVSFGVYGLTLWGIFSDPWQLAAVGVVMNGVAIGMLFIVGHDACHGSLTPSRKANRWIGRLAFLLPLHPFSGWAKSHNARHHRWTNLKELDPGYAPFSLAEFRQLSWFRRTLERLYRTKSGLGLYYFVEVWGRTEMFPPADQRPANSREFFWDRLLVATFAVVEYAGLAALAHATGRPSPYLFAAGALLIPLAVFMWVMGLVTFLHHTHPEIPWFDDQDEWTFFQGQVAGTTHVRFPPFMEWFFLNIAEHTAHHVDPLIPLYRLPESQKALETAYSAHIKVLMWSPLMVWRTMRRCKLYDYETHQWMNFRGEPTSPRLIPEKKLAEANERRLAVATPGV